MTNNQSKYDKAKQAYMAGKSYKEIGRMFGVTAATVRSWKRAFTINISVLIIYIIGCFYVTIFGVLFIINIFFIKD